MSAAGVASPSLSQHVLLLAAHGSSTDTVVIDRVREHAARVAELVPHDEVRIGFARGTPSLRDVVCDLRDKAKYPHVTLTVVPFMMSAGHYADRVMPQLLRASLADSDVPMVISRPLGASRRVAAILHRRALRLLQRNGWSQTKTAIVLVGHGTSRHVASRDTALAHARKLASLGWGETHAAFIDDVPDIATVMQSVASSNIIVLPFLVGGATHAAVDVPEALGLLRGRDESRLNSADDSNFNSKDEARAFEIANAGRVDSSQAGTINGRTFVLDAPLGVDAALADVAADLAIKSWGRVTRMKRGYSQRGGIGKVRVGTVHIVGAGPGAADLLTIRARRALRKAQVVVYDRLISPNVLALARPDAKLVDVGKWPHTPQDVQHAINETLIDAAKDGHRVVRLKGGDPFVFGRGMEEIEACWNAGIRAHFVPGLSSALAAPALAGIPVTARNVSRGFAVVTAATATDSDGIALHIRDYARVDTLIVLMGRSRLTAVCAQLIEAGRDPSTPVACVERSSLPGERTVLGTLETISRIANEALLENPMVTVIGPTAHFGMRERAQLQ